MEAVRVAPESSSAEALEGERKTVSALFGDIKGSMLLMQDRDPEERGEIRSRRPDGSARWRGPRYRVGWDRECTQMSGRADGPTAPLGLTYFSKRPRSA